MDHADALRRILQETPWIVEVFRVVRDLGPPGAFVGAGAIRNTVWDHLHGAPGRNPCDDIDVVFHAVAAPARDYAAALTERLPVYRWEVTNQATVSAATPHASLHDALRSWPETATAVAVAMTTADALEIVAPYGLDDLFAMTVRQSPGCSDRGAYLARAASKRWRQRWPRVEETHIPPERTDRT